MARPIKTGLDYFPLDVHIFEDEKIEAIAGEFGIKGELLVIKLLCAVYEKGYFVVWNDLTKAKLLKRLPGTSKDLLDQVVNRLVTWDFFDKNLFNSAKVLTSVNIQANYFEAIKRRKMQKPTRYVINVNINSSTEGVNDDNNAQIRLDKTKLNEINDEDYQPRVFQYLENNGFGSPYGNLVGEQIQEWFEILGKKGMDEKTIDDWLMMGIDVAIENNVRRWKYADTTLNSWNNQGLYTHDAIKGCKKRLKKFASSKQPDKRLNTDVSF